MKSFRTVLPPIPGSFALTHTAPAVIVGSCFSEHVGERLSAYKFPVLVNPGGILYNPISIARLLERLLDEEADFSDGFFYHQGLWHSWEHHGRYSHPERSVFEEQIRRAHRHAAAFSASATRLFLTLGTAQVFLLRPHGRIVANNHKAPADWFDRRRLSVAEVVESLSEVLEKWKRRRPELEVVLTVSPVRHLRDGLIENQRSKAALLLACDQLSERYTFVHYFAAYELLLDDLRDYRFYAADMVHPSEVAVDYIWEYFAQAFFPPQTAQLVARIARIRTAMTHRPFHPNTPEHRAFARQQYEAVEQIQREHPSLDFSEEKAHFYAFLSDEHSP